MRLHLILLCLCLSATACRYRMQGPPPLDEAVAVTVVTNRGRVVRGQAFLQRAVADELRRRLGWRIDPRGSARLAITLDREDIDVTAASHLDVPDRWRLTLRGSYTLTTARGEHEGRFTGDGFASGRNEEAAGIERAAGQAAAQLVSAIEVHALSW